jgi:hypothetical protein
MGLLAKVLAEAGGKMSKAERRNVMYDLVMRARTGSEYPIGWVEDVGRSHLPGPGYYRGEYDPSLSNAKNAQAMLRELLSSFDEWKATPDKRRYMLGQAKAIRENDLRTGSSWARSMYGLE